MEIDDLAMVQVADHLAVTAESPTESGQSPT
jgi:hypothetical protein